MSINHENSDDQSFKELPNFTKTPEPSISSSGSFEFYQHQPIEGKTLAQELAEFQIAEEERIRSTIEQRDKEAKKSSKKSSNKNASTAVSSTPSYPNIDGIRLEDQESFSGISHNIESDTESSNKEESEDEVEVEVEAETEVKTPKRRVKKKFRSRPQKRVHLIENEFYETRREETSHDNVLFLLNWVKDKEAPLSVSKRIFNLDFNNVIIIPSKDFVRNDVYIPFI